MSDQSVPSVVVADDDVDLRMLVEIKLRQSGFEVHAVDNGVDALAAIRGLRPDLAVLDVTMPGMSGPEVLAAVRADDALGSCRVLLLTGRDLDDALTDLADDYLAKPFSPRELVVRAQALALD